ncbi:hypothetical protein BDZ91DRAFT_732584 [Kalaharituber pfeilii]|nr:hypothetical protein BDZ91DRAFT_732584 [Kalaharituber pfeilii]
MKLISPTTLLITSIIFSNTALSVPAESSCACTPPKAPLIECANAKHPCHIYQDYQQCSPEWLGILELCMASGCIKWIRDPRAVCMD